MSFPVDRRRAIPLILLGGTALLSKACIGVVTPSTLRPTAEPTQPNTQAKIEASRTPIFRPSSPSVASPTQEVQINPTLNRIYSNYLLRESHDRAIDQNKRWQLIEAVGGAGNVDSGPLWTRNEPNIFGETGVRLIHRGVPVNWQYELETEQEDPNKGRVKVRQVLSFVDPNGKFVAESRSNYPLRVIALSLDAENYIQRSTAPIFREIPWNMPYSR